MTEQEAVTIIYDNYTTDNNSFLYHTHEGSRFEESAFWELYNAIRRLGAAAAQYELLDRELTLQIVKAYTWFLHEINFHFTPSDGYVIKNLPADHDKYTDRLRVVTEAYLEGRVIHDDTERILNESLPNPASLAIP